MPNVVVFPGSQNPSHDVSLKTDAEVIGLIYERGLTFMQEIPISEPQRPFLIKQNVWTGGRGRLRYQDDPSGYFDAKSIWSMTEGKLFPVPQWRFAKGIRSCDSDLPDTTRGVTWKPLLGAQLYISRSFSASASYSAEKGFLWVRRIGTPGTLTYRLHSNNAGDPGTVLQTVTKASTDVGNSRDYNPMSVFMEFDWTGTESLTASTTYHITIHGETTDNEANHWEVGCDSAGTASKISTTGSNGTWAAGSFGLYYRVVVADVNRKWHFFQIASALYAVSQADDSGNSQLLINGDVFKPTSANATSATDTSSGVSAGWTTDQYAAARMRIWDGTGDGQDAQITSNTSTAITFPTMPTAPTTASKIIIYDTDWWTEITGHGLGKVVNRPAVANGIAYLPQGESVAIRRIHFDNTAANKHAFAAETAAKASLVFAYSDKSGTTLWVGTNSNSKTASYTVPAWGSDLTSVLSSLKAVGSTDYPLSSFYAADALYIAKPDGLFRYEGSDPKRVKSMGFEDAVDTSNGVAVSVTPSGTWMGWNHSVIRIIGTSASDMMNYRQGYQGMPDDRQGYVSNIVSAMGWIFFVVDGGTTKTSTILAWNGIGWMELFRGWKAGVRIRSLFWQDNVNVRSRLWFDVDGDIAYIQFPLRCANPLLDEALAYQHEAYFITPTYDANEDTLYKLFHNFRIVMSNTNGTVGVDFQKNDEVGTGRWHNLGTMTNVTVKEFICDLGETYSVRFRLRLENSNPILPCTIESYSTEGWIVNPLKYQWVSRFKVGQEQMTKSSLNDFKPDDIVAFLKNAHQKSMKVYMRTLKKTNDDKVVVLTAPVITVTSLTDTGWSGTIDIGMREA